MCLTGILKGGLSRGQSKDTQGGVEVPCRIEHSDCNIFLEESSSQRTVPGLLLMDFKGQAIGKVLTCVTACAWNFHDFPLRKQQSPRLGTNST